MKSVLPRAVRDLSQELGRLPGIGPKTAKRLAIHLLKQPSVSVNRLADSIKQLHDNVYTCKQCFNLAESETCILCHDSSRDQSTLCIVENPLDVEAISRTDAYNGMFHVLGGSLSPLEGIDADQLTISELLNRLREKQINEIIFALNPTLEGDATIRHITQQISDLDLKISRLGRGLPTGGDIEFTDAVTLSAALEGRRNL